MLYSFRRIAVSVSVVFAVVSFCSAMAQPADSVEVNFRYRPNARAKQVSLAGSFNNWNPTADLMTRKGDTWTTSKRLPSGYYYYQFVVDDKWLSDPENALVAPDGKSVLKVGEPQLVRRQRAEPFPRDRVPRPILDGDTALVRLYYAAWEMAWNRLSTGTPENGFVEQYMDEGFNELIYQWDTCFMSAFGTYAPDLFPAMESLDNFYRKQRADGYIQRVYWEKDGRLAAAPTREEPMVNPPLFAWMEWRYYRMSADSSRLRRVLPVLIKYYKWIEQNCASRFAKGMLYNTPLGSGMDNTPRTGCEHGGWIDMSAQQVLAARCISRIAEVLGEETTALAYSRKAEKLSDAINELAWNPTTLFYHDVTRHSSRSSVKHIGAFWTLLSRVADPFRAAMLIQHLREPREFNRPHRVPALSADDPLYDPRGHYWLGGVWAPTNYMVVKGLEEFDQHDLANEIARNHLRMVSKVFYEFNPDESRIAYEERYADDYRTIWECYSPEAPEPATRWDGEFYCRQDFVGWSGLGPTALLIENVIGLQLIGAENRIVWRINRSDRHGLRNFKLKKQTVSLTCEPQSDLLSIDIRCEQPFLLTIVWQGQTYPREISTVGSNTIFIHK